MKNPAASEETRPGEAIDAKPKKVVYRIVVSASFELKKAGKCRSDDFEKLCRLRGADALEHFQAAQHLQLPRRELMLGVCLQNRFQGRPASADGRLLSAARIPAGPHLDGRFLVWEGDMVPGIKVRGHPFVWPSRSVLEAGHFPTVRA
jgi:hypothetical protein